MKKTKIGANLKQKMFADLECCDFFIYNDEMFFKLSKYPYVNALNVETANDDYNFANDTVVTPIIIKELIYSQKS